MPSSKRNVRVASLVLLTALLGGIFGCPEITDVIEDIFQPPEVRMRNVLITGISSTSAEFVLEIEIDNPNPIGVNLDRVDYQFDLAGAHLASGSDVAGLALKASGQSVARIPVMVVYNDLKTIYDSAKSQDYLDYALSGEVGVNTPIGEIPIPYKTTGKLPVVRPPQIKGVDVKVKNLTLTGASLDFTMKLYNPNVFALDISKLDYRLLLEGNDFANGRVESQTTPSKSTGKIKVPLHLDFASGLGWASTILAKRKANYSLDLDATYKIDQHTVVQHESKSGKVKF